MKIRLKKSKTKTRINLLICCFALIQIFVCFLSCSTYSNKEDKPELHGLYDVVRVVDGDTIVVNIDGEETKVRFIGVDTAESVHPDKTKNSESGKIASQWTSDLLTNQQVFLEYDVDKNDKYGRTLAYVYLSDGKTMVQEELLKAKMAEIMIIQPNVKYADDFYKIVEENE